MFSRLASAAEIKQTKKPLEPEAQVIHTFFRTLTGVSNLKQLGRQQDDAVVRKCIGEPCAKL
jgi:hypothetical protein